MVLAAMHLGTVPWGAFLLLTIQNHTIPYHAKPHDTTPYHICSDAHCTWRLFHEEVSCTEPAAEQRPPEDVLCPRLHPIPHSMQYYTIPHHSVTYHTIPYHTKTPFHNTHQAIPCQTSLHESTLPDTFPQSTPSSLSHFKRQMTQLAGGSFCIHTRSSLQYKAQIKWQEGHLQRSPQSLRR